MYFDFPYSIDNLIVESFMAEYPPEWFYVQQNELFLDVAEYQTFFYPALFTRYPSDRRTRTRAIWWTD